MFRLKRPRQPVFTQTTLFEQKSAQLQLLPNPYNRNDSLGLSKGYAQNQQKERRENNNDKKYKFSSIRKPPNQPRRNENRYANNKLNENASRNNYFNDSSTNGNFENQDAIISNKYPVWGKEFGNSGGPVQPMKVITVTPTSLNQWKLLQNKALVMYELYGVLDSAITSSRNGTAKHFVLRSGKDSTAAVFYEIDRSIPEMTKGEWQRCVGSFDTLGNFRVVSVRHASDKEIHNLDAALLYMRKVMANFCLLNEP